MRFAPIIAIPVQAADSVNSAAIPTENILNVSAQLVATGSAAGTLKFQCSNDNPVAGNTPPTNWSDIPSATVSVSGAGVFLIPDTAICYQWVRLVYANSGTGTFGVMVKTVGF